LKYSFFSSFKGIKVAIVAVLSDLGEGGEAFPMKGPHACMGFFYFNILSTGRTIPIGSY